MKRIYSALDSNIDVLKTSRCRKSTKKSTLSWMTVFNNWKTTNSYTEEMHTYQPEDLNLILEKFYGELRKSNGTDFEPVYLKSYDEFTCQVNIMSLFYIFF